MSFWIFGIFMFACILAQSYANPLPKYEISGNILPMEYYQHNVLTSIQCKSSITLEKIKFKEDDDRLSWDVAHPRIIDNQIVFFIKHRLTNDIATCATPINYTDSTSLVYVTLFKDGDVYFAFDDVTFCAFWEENDERIAWCPRELTLDTCINRNYITSLKCSSFTHHEILIQRQLNSELKTHAISNEKEEIYNPYKELLLCLCLVINVFVHFQLATWHFHEKCTIQTHNNYIPENQVDTPEKQPNIPEKQINNYENKKST